MLRENDGWIRRYAVGLARKRASLELDDLLAVGRMAAIEAWRVFDASRGIPFWGFAARRVRGAMIDYLRWEGRFNGYVREQHRQVGASPRRRVAVMDDIEDLDQLRSPAAIDLEGQALAASVWRRIDGIALPRRHRTVLEGLRAGQSTAELADELRVTPGRISQIRAAVFRRVRRALGGPPI